MKEITVIIDGEEYIARPKNETATAEKPKTGYEKVGEGEIYYFGCDCGKSSFLYDRGANNFESANYYSDETVAQNNARAGTLMRKLRQWQALNDEPVDWGDAETNKWRIGYDYDGKAFYVDFNSTYRHLGQIYFSSYAKANEAIEVLKDELIWYFTEYMQRLDEPKHN